MLPGRAQPRVRRGAPRHRARARGARGDRVPRTCTSSSPARAPRPRGRRCAPPSCRTCPGRDFARGPSAHPWRRRARRSRGGGENAPRPARAALPDRGRPRAAAHSAALRTRAGRAPLGASLLRGVRRRRRRAGSYREFNFSPSGEWAAYAFRGYREGTPLGVPDPGIAVRSDGRALELCASVEVERGEAARGLCVVIEELDGALSYWALRASAAASRTSITPTRSRWSSHEVRHRSPARGPGAARALAGRRVALLAHPASVTRDLAHSLDALAALPDVTLTAAFGPQHGLRGDKQDNMVESPDFTDPVHGIPVFSLYGEVRRPTDAMMETFDVLLVDLQDLGCRIYTFITTLRYVLEAAAQHGKAVWVLDRPNPVGRPVEGLTLRAGLGELRRRGPAADAPRPDAGRARRAGSSRTLRAGRRVPRSIAMEGWQPDAAPGFGWPLGERAWVNPSPNAPNLWMARCYAGTVMLEGTTLSEGRGTTRPLELFGAPDLDARGAARDDARARAAVAARLPPARRAGSSRPSTSTSASSAPACRSTSRSRPTTTTAFRPWRLHGARVQGAARAAARLSAVARLPLRVRARPAGHRRHQRRRAAARSGSTIRPPRRPTSTRWRVRGDRPGSRSASAYLLYK